MTNTQTKDTAEGNKAGNKATSPPPNVMLACTVKDISTLEYPLFASIKYDGVRAHVHAGVLYSRSNKPIKNKELQARYARWPFDGFDGELTLPAPRNTASEVLKVTASVNADASEIEWRVFDAIPDTAKPTYYERLEYLAVSQVLDGKLEDSSTESQPTWVLQATIRNETELLDFMQHKAANEEGIMLRGVYSTYTKGRSTLAQASLLRIFTEATHTAEVVSIIQAQKNTNERELNEKGTVTRSTAKAGMEPKEETGAFICVAAKDIRVNANLVVKQGTEFKVAAGSMTRLQREKSWEMKDKQQRVIFVHKPYGAKDTFRQARVHAHWFAHAGDQHGGDLSVETNVDDRGEK